MGHATKYGRITAEHKEIPEDEPVFIIRGKDCLAVPTIDYYISQVATRAPNQQFLEQVSAVCDYIQEWQRANPHRVSNPD